MNNELLQCPTCGRIRETWGNEDTKHLAIGMTGNAVKGKQRSDNEDRIASYRSFRFSFGVIGSYVSDIDHLEYGIIDGIVTPYAILELTRIDGDIPIRGGYLSKILERFTKRDAQKRFITTIGNSLGVNVYIVAFRHDITEFWLYNLSRGRGWKMVNRDGYIDWIKTLPNSSIKEVSSIPMSIT